MRPGPDLDHGLAVLLGWWLPEEDAVPPATAIYRPPKFSSHLPGAAGASGAFECGPSAIQLLTLLELAGVKIPLPHLDPIAHERTESLSCLARTESLSFKTRQGSLLTCLGTNDKLKLLFRERPIDYGRAEA